jgi:hypothetical protein
MDPSGIMGKTTDVPLRPSDGAPPLVTDDEIEDDDGPETWPGLFA